MSAKIALCIIIVCLFHMSVTLKDSSGFQQHQTSPADPKHIFKNVKKARIVEKQKFELNDFIDSLKEFFSSVYGFIGNIFDHLIVRKAKSIQKTSIIYRENFASQNGGGQILMVSSSQIKSPKAILKNDPDAYLFTADVLPITIVIGLKEQILIDSFVIQSEEVYSCITQDFMIEGAFSLQNEEWILLGNFTAQNSFQPQQFTVQPRIIRYLRLTILSSYGKWKYFTLTEVQVYGQGLFSHALESLLQTEHEMEKNKSIQESLHKKNSSKRLHPDKFSDKVIRTKQVLVEAFQEAAVKGKEARIINQHKQQHLANNPQVDETKTNQSQVNEKSGKKQKKSITNLKKKISYLEKRNYELNQEMKQLKQLTTDKFTQLQTKHHQKETHKHHHHKDWYTSLLDSSPIIIISMAINIACLILVAMVFKNKMISSEKRSTKKLDEADTEKKAQQKPKIIPSKKQQKQKQKIM